MGVTRARALLFVMVASVVLACLGPLQWWHLAGAGGDGLNGTSEGLTSFGDGKVAIGAAAAAVALAYFGAVRRINRSLAGVGICLVACLMFALCLGDIIHPPRSPLGFIPDAGGYHATIWLYFVAATSLAIGLAGAYIATPSERRRSHRQPLRNRGVMGVTTQNTLKVIVWLSAALAVVAFVPWADAHTLNISADGPRSMTALSDAALFASVALGCAFLAWQMLRDPSELVWAGLVVAGGVLFVFSGAEITESTQACGSNGTVLGFMSAGFGCFREGGYTLSPGQVVLWVVLSVSALVAILGLGLPIIESIGRDNETPERSEQW
jgi:hypothetical protein